MEYSLTETIFQFAFLAVFLVPLVLYLLTLQNTLKQIAPESRLMNPGQAWLVLIPFYGIVYQFILVDKLARSIGAECVRLNIPVENYKPTFGIGLTMCVFNCLFWIPFVGIAGSMLTWIIHWVKVSEYKKRIIANQFNFTLDAERNIFYGDHGPAETNPEV